MKKSYLHKYSIKSIRTAFFVFTLILSLSSGISLAETVPLYDSAQDNLPSAQGWTPGLYPFPPIGNNEAVQEFNPAGGYTRLDTTADISDMAGYFSSFPGIPPHPDIPESLDYSKGFMLSFAVQIVSENHNSQNRAGFSVIITGDEYSKAIELGFWENEIWAQEGGTDKLFTHAEGTSFDTGSQMNAYDLLIYADVYELYANGVRILNGALRDYSAFSGNPPFNYPYTTPRFIFLGDDTSSAEAESYLQSVHITLPLLGNADNGKDVGLEDAILLLKILAGTDMDNTEISIRSDVNRDGVLGLAEVIFVLRNISEYQ